MPKLKLKYEECIKKINSLKEEELKRIIKVFFFKYYKNKKLYIYYDNYLVCINNFMKIEGGAIIMGQYKKKIFENWGCNNYGILKFEMLTQKWGVQ